MEHALTRLVTRRGFDCVLFVVFALVLVLANRTAIEARNVEYGDFAANSLLIQTAKTGHLLVGNYSRVGFNHPGPAILDVLALGEAIFFDRLHWVPSPFSGQLVAVALYNAFWMMLIVRLWRRLAIDTGTALTGAAVFFIGAALMDVRFYAGPWFPHLYFFPFATFLLAAARWGSGRSDDILSLAIGLGFLINGHVAFMPITAIVLASALAANWNAFKGEGENRVVLKLSWLKAHRRAALQGILTVSIFLIPLGIETVRKYPGPVGDYLRFGSGHRRNTFDASLDFVAMYWGGLPFLVLPAALMAFIYRCRFAEAEASRSMRSMIAVMAGASMGLVLYAMYGVDMLYASYIGMFYSAVPALLLAVGAICLLQSRTFARREMWIALLAVFTFSIACVELPREPDYTADYRAPELENLYDALHDIKDERRLVVDLGPRYPATWPVVAGIDLIAVRRGVGLMCIGRGWHILFTIEARCTTDEVEHGRHVLAGSTSLVKPSDQPRVAEGLGVSFVGGEKR